MRRIAIALVTLSALACDPTGNAAPDFDTASFRFGNFVTNATGLAVTRGNGNLANNITFGTLSSPTEVLTGQGILVTKRVSDGFLLETDTTNFFLGRRYTMYAIGEVTSAVTIIAQQDTVLASGGQFKVRFIHGVKSEESFTLDFFADTATSLSGVTPMYPGLSYGVSSLYVPVDTNIRRFRWTRNGNTTPVFDTTFTSSIPAGAVVTFVVTNLQGGSSPIRVTRVNDTLP